jgi:Asp-tRNA(Asn)/Glu-tRNA(Gln) amidotransferase A subunit family amidase
MFGQQEVACPRPRVRPQVRLISLQLVAAGRVRKHSRFRNAIRFFSTNPAKGEGHESVLAENAKLFSFPSQVTDPRALPEVRVLLIIREMNLPKRASRRRILKHVAAAGAVSVLPRISDAASTKPATTRSTGPLIEDLEAAERVLGHEFTDAENLMSLGSMGSKRKLMLSLRARTIDPNVEPAVQFNPRLPGTKLPEGPSSFTVSKGSGPESDDVDSLAFASATDLSRLIHARKITSLALTKMYLKRLDTIGRKLNAVITLCQDVALAQAKRADEELAAGKDRGPLHGLPYAPKDLLATKNIPTTWGVEIYKDRVLDHDATVIRKLEEAGAVLCAKLSLGELCMGDVWYGGLTRCPWSPKEGSSGSSAGPCAAVAAGLIAFSIGSETLGSIISPCMVNGTTGLRPTYGRVSRYGAMPLARTLDKLGPITRSVEDSAMVLSAIFGADERDPTAADVPFRWDTDAIDVKNLRVGFDPAAFDFESEANRKSPKLTELRREAFEKLRSLVAEMKPIKLPAVEPYSGITSFIIACESASSFAELLHSGEVRKLKQQTEGSWPNTFRTGAMIPAADYLRGMQVRTQLQHELAQSLKDIDVMVTLPYVGPTIAYTNLTGHPSLVTRYGIYEGRPKLIEFIGQLYREDQILQLGHAFEKAMDLENVWPKL